MVHVSIYKTAAKTFKLIKQHIVRLLGHASQSCGIYVLDNFLLGNSNEVDRCLNGTRIQHIYYKGIQTN